MKTNTELLQEQLFEINDLPFVNFEVEETTNPCLEIKWYDEYLDMDYLQVIMDYFGDHNPHIYSNNELNHNLYPSRINGFKLYIIDKRNELPY